MIEEFIKQFTNEKIPYFKLHNQYFKESEHLKNQRLKIKEEPFSSGIFLGTQKGNKFIPTPALIDEIAKHTDAKTTIDKKAEWLFICGRDVFPSSILQSSRQKLTIVINEEKEVLGYGKLQRDPALKHLQDKGEYLRMER